MYGPVQSWRALPQSHFYPRVARPVEELHAPSSGAASARDEAVLPCARKRAFTSRVSAIVHSLFRPRMAYIA